MHLGKFIREFISVEFMGEAFHEGVQEDELDIYPSIFLVKTNNS